VTEADTTYRSAAALRTALLGKELLRFEAPQLIGIRPSVGRVIEEVRSHGKHIEIIWDDGVVLNTHLRKFGSWNLYRAGESWKKSKDRASAVIVVSDWIAVCFNSAVVETYKDFDPRRHPILGRRGPDLCRADADLEECVDRIINYQERDTPIADVLLDQRVMCGVGNVYRCELLWACEMHPWAHVGSLKRGECREMVMLASEMIQANLDHTPRSIAVHFGGGLAVYGRQGKHCHRCGDVIKVTHHGEAHRVLYWCPNCQVIHQPLMRPNFTPVYIERDISRGILHSVDAGYFID
jgi:endonuclease-8